MDPVKELRKRLASLGRHDPVRCLWQKEVGHKSTLSCYVFNGHLFLVQEWEDGAGWDLYVPASTKNDVEDTMKAAVAYLTGP